MKTTASIIGNIVDMQDGEISRLKAENAKLRDVLAEVMTWIDNWSPSFVYDDEWPETKRKVEIALVWRDIFGTRKERRDGL